MEETFNYYTVKLNTTSITQALADIQKDYATLFPGSPFDYFFLNEFFDRQYQADYLFNTLFSLFAGLALLVACLGLLALSSYLMARRTKEVGIRKVLGASGGQVMILLTKDFLTLVLFAGLMAIPLAYFVVDYWLQHYAFRIGLLWWLFAIPPVSVLLLTLAMVGLQTIKTARVNPIRGLRYE